MSLPDRPGRTDHGGSTADAHALQEAKQLLRAAVRQRRTARSEQERATDDHARFLHLQRFWGMPTAGSVVAIYLSHGSEPSTLELISWLAAHQVRILLPVLDRQPDGRPRREPDWAAYAGPERLRAGLWGIPEPTTEPLGATGLAEAAVIVCSGLAGTERGDRLGVGGGWYDRARAYAAADAVSLLLLNDDEVLPTLPVQPWDRPVDVIATPTRLLRAGG
ncbi:5-formyltetrahydrofolate cyclo-ligase [Enemella dayhoffiae]|uniref:5-formyltetrahydrofolate cyclo-ligase n=1 Tax=Enemella dayhoffiae TaxID=2016507 RepID=A0A255HC38_9ACTN|nr:5-formyltetrahydrofolate cyclo-ligase [Enemella dayhoffiae]OYO24523.1 5-formyltetrahydrofolate cyclo-ligase [Enemella dayhoffiae]